MTDSSVPGWMTKNPVWTSPVPQFVGTVHDFTVGQYLTDVYNLEIPCQRGSVWTVRQQRLFIRSIIARAPIGLIVISEDDSAKRPYRVVDGKQRIETIRRFGTDAFRVPAIWFDETAPQGDLITGTEARRYGWDSRVLPSRHVASNRRYDRITRTWIDISISEQLRMEADMFLMVNTGGVPQTVSHLGKVAVQGTKLGRDPLKPRKVVGPSEPSRPAAPPALAVAPSHKAEPVYVPCSNIELCGISSHLKDSKLPVLCGALDYLTSNVDRFLCHEPDPGIKANNSDILSTNTLSPR